jgi:hypothetical protein
MKLDPNKRITLRFGKEELIVTKELIECVNYYGMTVDVLQSVWTCFLQI